MNDKKKMTNSEKIDALAKSIQFLREDFKNYKEKEQGKEIEKGVQEIVSKDKFSLQGNIKFFQTENIEKQRQDFFNDLQKIMIKYKVYQVIANLLRKF